MQIVPLIVITSIANALKRALTQARRKLRDSPASSGRDVTDGHANWSIKD